MKVPPIYVVSLCVHKETKLRVKCLSHFPLLLSAVSIIGQKSLSIVVEGNLASIRGQSDTH